MSRLVSDRAPRAARGRLRQVLPCILAGMLLASWRPTTMGPASTMVESERGSLHHASLQAAETSSARFPAMSDAEAWARLPARISGAAAPLPAWARTLAPSLPRTTAAMLELDHAHRAGSPLDPRVRGMVRWTAAHALNSPYGEASALADLRTAGVPEADIQGLTNETGTPPADMRELLAFVRRLSTAADSITDDEVAALVERYGANDLVAIVFGVAYANFLDRLVLALGISVEPGGPRPALDVRFARRWLVVDPATSDRPRLRPPLVDEAVDAGGLRDPEWAAADLADLRCKVTARKSRRARIPLPAADPTANRWGLVGQTYQRPLAVAWSACPQAFAEEADQDPVFDQCLFWVVTRTKHCFYCMGHTEMMFTVSGLSRDGTDARLRVLAGGDWSSFRPDQRTALQFAYKQARSPASIEARDVRALIARCGPERALDAIWWSCRCHYMMCVADAFLLPLEGINVFDGFDPDIMRVTGPGK